MIHPMRQASSTAVVVACLAAGAGVGGQTPPAARPASLLIDLAYVTGARARIAEGDAQLRAALDALERDARAALALTPPSVMDKGVTPPSGDKHDYMSQAPYWWPDPTKPDGKPYIQRDGVRNPELKKISDHDNFGRVMSAVSTLGLAYRFDPRPEYAAQAARLVRVWFLDPATRMNPHLQFGQGIPGITDGRGIGIIETVGLPDLLDGVIATSGAPAWTAADQAGLDAWMRAYLTWLIESPHGKAEAKNGNNHETWYDVQVAAFALYTGQSALARRTLEGVPDRVLRQIEPDGRQPRELARTRSWHYCIYNLTALFNLATIGERVGVDLWRAETGDGRSLRKALDFLVPFAAGERPWPYPELTAFEPGEIHRLLRRAASAWNEPRYRALAAKVGGGSARLDLTLR
jgi:hypothetical protein